MVDMFGTVREPWFQATYVQRLELFHILEATLDVLSCDSINW